MSDNWIVQNLNSALSTWSEKMAELWTLLTENPATFKGGGIWRIMTNINDALTAIAYGLLVLFFAAGIIKTCGSFTDIKKPEHVLKAFIRFALAQGMAAATGARFGRSCFSGAYMGEYGVYVSNSGEAVRHRKALGMEHLKLLFKVNPEADAYLVQRDIQVVARSIMFGDFADGLCVSGAAAGAEPDDVVLSRVHEAAKQKNVPVFCNTGCNHQNVREKLKHCDAVCIGSAFKKDGIFNQRVDEKRVRDFMEIVKEIRGES